MKDQRDIPPDTDSRASTRPCQEGETTQDSQSSSDTPVSDPKKPLSSKTMRKKKPKAPSHNKRQCKAQSKTSFSPPTQSQPLVYCTLWWFKKKLNSYIASHNLLTYHLPPQEWLHKVMAGVDGIQESKLIESTLNAQQQTELRKVRDTLEHEKQPPGKFRATTARVDILSSQARALTDKLQGILGPLQGELVDLQDFLQWLERVRQGKKRPPVPNQGKEADTPTKGARGQLEGMSLKKARAGVGKDTPGAGF